MSVMTNYAHGQFCWVDLMAHDMVTAQAFYEELFGWEGEVQDTQGGPLYALFRLRGMQVAGIGQMPEAMKSQGTPPVWNSYINVMDLERILDQVHALGGAVLMPPMQVMEAGRMATIQDSSGAVVSLWEKLGHIGAELVSEGGAFCWNELATHDLAAARDFYSKLFAWQFEDFPGGPAEYNVIKNQGELNGGLMQITEQMEGMPPVWSVYFAVDNCDNAVARLETLGGRICAPPFDIGVGRMAVVSDQQGGTFSMIQLNSPEA